MKSKRAFKLKFTILKPINECKVLREVSEAPSASIKSRAHCLKVRHWKTNFTKASAWRNSTGAGLLENDGAITVQDKLHKMCPHFERLEEIFAPKTSSTEVLIDTERSESPEAVEYLEIEQLGSEDMHNNTLDSIIQSPEMIATVSSNGSKTATVRTPLRTIAEPARKIAEKMQNNAPRKYSSSGSQMVEFQKERANINKMRLEYEKEKLAVQKETDDKRFTFEEKKFEEELKLKRQEIEVQKMAIEQQERIKKMELEKEERIAMFKIKAKYGKTD